MYLFVVLGQQRVLHERPLLSHGAYSVLLSDPQQPAAHVTHVDVRYTLAWESVYGQSLYSNLWGHGSLG
jgi:hypothetical protein